jgi:hypothetical protein
MLTYQILNLPDTDFVRYGTGQILNLSDTEIVRNYQQTPSIPVNKLSRYKFVRYRTFKIPNLSDTEHTV